MYDEIIKELINKYGRPKGPYIIDNHINKAIRKEGLFIHHVSEFMILPTSKDASHSPISLVYCNYLEHLQLHLAIFNERPQNMHNIDFLFYLIKEISEAYITNKGLAHYEVIKNDLDSYITILAPYYQFHKVANYKLLEYLHKSHISQKGS